MEQAGSIIILLGSLIYFTSALGLLRMPDVYNRLQAGTKATTLALMLICIGACFLQPDWTAKLTALFLFVVLTAPLSSHALARAALKSGINLFKKGG